MWGIEHSAMAIIAAIVTGWLLASRDWFALLAMSVSQAPFWIGFVVFSAIQVNPTQYNMVTDLAASAAFVWLAYRFDQAWLIWLAVVFLCAGIADVYASRFGINNYLELHEVLHYTALILIMGRSRIVRVDRRLHNWLSSLSN